MLGNLGPFGLVVIGFVLLLFFGRGRIPQLMGDMAKGVTAFRKGLKEDPEESEPTVNEAKTIEAKVEEKASEVVERSKSDV